MSDFLWSHGLYRVHGILQARILEWVPFLFSRGSSQLRDWTQVFLIAGRFFTSWATGKPKNTGVGSLSLLSGSSWPKNRTWVSSIAGGFFTNWAMREDPRRCLTSGINTISYCYCYVNCSSLGETAWKLWVLQIYIEHLPHARSKCWRESGELSKVCFTGSLYSGGLAQGLASFSWNGLGM